MDGSMPVEPRAGDFGVVHVSGEGGKLIRAGQWLNGSGYRDYEHAFMYVGRGEVIEAQPSGARIDQLTTQRVLWSHYNLTMAQRLSLVRIADSLVGTPYSWPDYFALAARRFRVPVPGLHKYIADSGHMICSQLVDYCYQKAGIQLFNDGRWPGDVTPADLANLIA